MILPNGAKVKIKKGIELKNHRANVAFVPGMKKEEGTICTIRSHHFSQNSSYRHIPLYNMEENVWTWLDDFFEIAQINWSEKLEK